VVVRLRPMNENEKKHGTLPVVTASTQDKSVTVIKGQGSKQMKTCFTFDNVFTAFSTQEEVFEETLKPVISDVMKGFESTVFAYGQTGTGKTHTMEGSLSTPEMYGVIPRSAQAIFESLKQPQYGEHTVTCSYLEIYNEELCDLLADEVKASEKKTTKLEIMDGKNGTFCRGLVEIKVKTAEDVLALMSKAQMERKIGETKMNKQSSRSHCIFSMRVKAKSTLADGSGTMDFNGKLHMVDLAGSECAKTASLDKASGAEAARERERMNINRSLLTLGRVISMLKDRSEKKKSGVRIPYRDSKLTRILQESLGGRCKTVVVATLSPSITAIDESISTLNYAQSASGIVNKPVATSYMNLTPCRSVPAASASGESNGTDNANSVEHWHEMECRLQYMQAQVEEAQAALARKHMQQQELVDRVEKAETEKLEFEQKYFDATKQMNGLKESLAEEVKKKEKVITQLQETEFFLKKTTAVLHATQKTEVCLTNEATKLLSTLKESVADGETLHALVVSQREVQSGYKSAGKDFNVASLKILTETKNMLADLSSKTDKYHDFIKRSAGEVHDQERMFIDEMSTLMKEIRHDVMSLADTIKHQVVNEGGLMPAYNDFSTFAMRELNEASSVITQGEHKLLSTCKSSRQKLKETSDKLDNLSAAHKLKSTESLSTLESGIASSKEKIQAMIESLTKALFVANDARTQARVEHKVLLEKWKLSSLDVSKCVEEKSKHQSGKISETLKFFAAEMRNHDQMESTLQHQNAYINENGQVHIDHVTEQGTILSRQRESLALARDHNQRMHESFMQTVMDGVQKIMANQMELLKAEQSEQFTTLENSTESLNKVNSAMGQSAKEIFAEVKSTNSKLNVHVQNVRKNDTHVANIMENTKDTLDQITASSMDHEKSISTYANKLSNGLCSMDKLDSQTEEIIDHVKSDGVLCIDHLEDVVLDQNKGSIENLTQAGVKLSVNGANAVTNFLSDLETIEQPRKTVLCGFDHKVKQTISRISSCEHNMKEISDKHSAAVDELCDVVQTKERIFESDVGTRRRKQVEKDMDRITEATLDNSKATASIISTATSRSGDLRDQVKVFTNNTLKIEEAVADAPIKPSHPFNIHLTKTPSENVILQSVDFDSSDEMSIGNGSVCNTKNGSPHNDENCDTLNSRQRNSESSQGSTGSLNVPSSPSLTSALQERSLNRDVVMSSGKGNKSCTERNTRPLKNSAVKKSGVRRSASTPPTYSRKKARTAPSPSRHMSAKAPRMRKNM